MNKQLKDACVRLAQLPDPTIREDLEDFSKTLRGILEQVNTDNIEQVISVKLPRKTWVAIGYTIDVGFTAMIDFLSEPEYENGKETKDI
mgnify:CR=1 FL=1|tara:strand:- start:935 stop:1201 length:267 start_codon:yes stop_codon:yes gene_type:complete